MASFLILVRSIVRGGRREQTEQQKLEIENNRLQPVGGQAQAQAPL